MPIIKGITEFKWDLSKKGFKNTVRLYVSLFTDEKKLRNWVYLYTFVLVPILNFLIIYKQEDRLISLGGGFSPVKYSLISITLMSILISFTIFTFIISLVTFKRVRPLLFASMFTQILILFFEINIIRMFTLYEPDFAQLCYLFFVIWLLSILFVIIQLLKIIYLTIKHRVLLKKN
ncbi:MAG: hypothetical protein ACTSVO_05790 [Candidatus Heimdallarchaeaceae archaeon]